MQYEKILVRFGELSLKGKNKMTFVNCLSKHIKTVCNLEKSQLEAHIDRIFLPFSENNIKKLNYVFGISSFSPVLKVKTNLEQIKKILLEIDFTNYKNFKISSRRKWKQFELTSLEMNNLFGSLILEKNKKLKVKVNEPDLEINIEVHKDYSYIFWEKIKGLGGLPVGTGGKTLHLLSGGIDSPVAAIEMIKRGIKVDFLSFISPPHTDEKTIEKLKLIVEEITKYQLNSKLYLFNYTEIMNYLSLTSKQSYKIILMRRSFYRIATKIAKLNNCLGISNGENLGQVASQTMEAMNVIHNQSDLPIYQPLLTNDKIETIIKAQKFNLFNISIIKACETCELFAPDHPTTKPNLNTALELEKELDMLETMEEQAIKNKIQKLIFKANC